MLTAIQLSDKMQTEQESKNAKLALRKSIVKAFIKADDANNFLTTKELLKAYKEEMQQLLSLVPGNIYGETYLSIETNKLS